MPEPLADARRKSIILPNDLLIDVEAWRRHQYPIPNESQAIRRLIELGLTVQPADKQQRPAPRTRKRASS